MEDTNPLPSPSPKKKAARFHEPKLGIKYAYGESLRFDYDAEFNLIVAVSGRIPIAGIERKEFIELFGIEMFQQILRGK